MWNAMTQHLTEPGRSRWAFAQVALERAYWVLSALIIPVAIALFSLTALSFWDDLYSVAPRQQLELRAAQDASQQWTIAQAEAQLTKVRPKKIYETKLSEDPVWFLLEPSTTDQAAALVEIPSRHLVQMACWNARTQAPLGYTTPEVPAGDLIEVCQSRIHHDPFHLSKDGNFSWEEVECLGACVNAPMVLIWKDTYEDLTKENFGKVLDGFASGNPPKPGPQIDRQFSAPVGGPTTLKETT